MQITELIRREWQLWGLVNAPQVTEAFVTGMNHQCYKLTTGDQQLVLKLFDPTQNITRRQIAIETQQLASENNLSAQVVYVSEDTSYLLMEYIEQSSTENSMSTRNMALLVKNLRSLHALQPLSSHTPFNATDYINNYWEVRTKDLPYEAVLKSLYQEMQPLLSAFDALGKTSLCHNDLVVENICFSHDNVLFLDWEYAQMNTPWFDLASLVIYLKLNEHQTIELLKHYLNNIYLEAKKIKTEPLRNNEVMASLHTCKAVVLWLDILWHLSHAHSLINQTKTEQAVSPQIEVKLDQLCQLLTE